VLISCLSAVLAQQQQYAWSSALLRLPNGLLIFPIGLMLLRRNWLDLHFILVAFLVLLFFVLVLSLALLNRRLKRGRARLTFKQRLPGLTFLIALVAIIATQRGMITVAGAILTPERVAALAALIVLLRVFDLVGEPTGRVFSTEMARNPGAITRSMLVMPWFIAAILSVLLLVALPPIARHFYAGRYDAALPLLPWLVAAAALRLVELVPRGFAFYLASIRALNVFAAVQSAIAIAGIILMVKWTQNFDLRGTVWAGAIIAVIRVAISYAFFAAVRRGSATSRQRFDVEPLQVASEEPPV
jgi:hypothetical protein